MVADGTTVGLPLIAEHEDNSIPYFALLQKMIVKVL
jgi:hypothetical protein